MPSLRKLEAARLNGAKARGRKTPGGIAISSLNAIRHGLSARTIVLGNESRERYDAILNEYIEEFQPESAAEKDAVEELAFAKWQLRRYLGVETAILDLQMDKQAPQIALDFTQIDEMTRLAIAFQTLADHSNALQLLDRYSSKMRRLYDRAFQHLLDLR